MRCVRSESTVSHTPSGDSSGKTITNRPDWRTYRVVLNLPGKGVEISETYRLATCSIFVFPVAQRLGGYAVSGRPVFVMR